MKLSAFLHKYFPDLSLNQIKKAIEQNGCKINGRVEKFHSYLVAKGEELEFNLPEKREIPSLEVIFEDEYFLIYNKPPFVNSETFPLIAHRLDRETSGCLFAAKTEKALAQAELLFKNREIVKEYLAVVEGIPKTASGIIESTIGKLTEFLWGESKKGKYAKTEWQLQKKGQGISLILCKPETGRTHQIRIHMASIQHPILGDHLYGKQFSHSSPRILLHAYKLTFTHPYTHKHLEITAPIPTEIKELFI